MIWGGELRECADDASRVRAVIALPATNVEALDGKAKELWRLGKRLLGHSPRHRKEAALSLSEAVCCGLRYLPLREGPAFWAQLSAPEGPLLKISGNDGDESAPADSLNVLVIWSWAQWWLMSAQLQMLRQAHAQQRVARDVLAKRTAMLGQLANQYREVLEKALSQYPTPTKGNDGKSDGGNSNVATVVERGRERCVLYVALSVYYGSNGKPNDELLCAQKASLCDPTSIEALLRYANALLFAKKLNDAQVAFQQAAEACVAGAPETAVAWCGVTYCLLEEGGATEGSAKLKEAVQRARQCREGQLKNNGTIRMEQVSPEVAQLWSGVVKTILPAAQKEGRCGWCLKEGADKRCSACLKSEYCSPDCFKAAWRGDEAFPAHKAVCSGAKK